VEKQLAELEKVSNPPPERTWWWVFVFGTIPSLQRINQEQVMMSREQLWKEAEDQLPSSGISLGFVGHGGGEL
jgi:hypothetical protein